MSQASHPSAVISARLIGRNGAAVLEGFSAMVGVSILRTHKTLAR
jgi:hypothetical protein